MGMSVYVVRAFVHLRQALNADSAFARQFAQLEARLQKKLAEHDPAIVAILATIRELISPRRQSRCSRSANYPNGVLERPLRDDDAEAFRGFEVDDQLEDRVLDGHTSWLLTVEDFSRHLSAGLA